ncbi:MAG: GPW/gp25 family protein [Bacteroidota bacterium]|nr:GPW/gp25 family protein [Bacteroidota bacterium]
MNGDKSFLGNGWSFPPMFDKVSRTVLLVSEEEDIAQSLQVLLSTRPGERVMQPSFGCNLDIMLFEPLTTTLIAYVKDLIETSVLYFEPRIDMDAVNINTTEEEAGLILIELQYTVLSTNSRYNLVYPYYLGEGTEADFTLNMNLKKLIV